MSQTVFLTTTSNISYSLYSTYKMGADYSREGILEQRVFDHYFRCKSCGGDSGPEVYACERLHVYCKDWYEEKSGKLH